MKTRIHIKNGILCMTLTLTETRDWHILRRLKEFLEEKDDMTILMTDSIAKNSTVELYFEASDI